MFDQRASLGAGTEGASSTPGRQQQITTISRSPLPRQDAKDQGAEGQARGHLENKPAEGPLGQGPERASQEF